MTRAASALASCTPHHRHVLVLLIALLGLPGPTPAHLGDLVYPVYELSSADLPDLHDGTLEDWEDILPNAALDHNDFQFWNIGLGGRIDPANLAVRIFLAWHHDSQRIYVAVERLDDIYLGSGVCCDAATLFSVDGDHSGGQYLFVGDEYSQEESRHRTGAQAQSYTAYPESSYGGRLLLTQPEQMWVAQPPWADYGGWQFGESPNLSAVEFYVTPWDDLVWDDPDRSRRSALEPGRILGLQVTVDDGDVPNRSAGTYTLAVPTVDTFVHEGDFSYGHFGFAENFVDAELVPCTHGDCSGARTSVESSSWGRVKAAFR